MEPPRRLLVLHDRPDEVRPVFAARAPELALAVAPSPSAVGPMLQKFQPDAVFSITQSGPTLAPAGHSARR